jgi:hypothetical protein
MDPEAQKMSEAYRLGEQASVVSQLYGSVAPFAVASAMANAQRAGSLLSPLTVFHGSPHKFSKFDASKIGTGEGAQVYGHGIYLAESPDVAKGYQSRLSGSNYLDAGTGSTVDSGSAWERAVKAVQEAGISHPDRAGQIASQIQDWVDKGRVSRSFLLKHQVPKNLEPGYQAAIDVFQNLRQNKGAFYKADLPDEEIAKMLDWDKPLSQQSRTIQKFALENSKPLAKLVKFQQANKLNENPPKSIYDLSGGELMRELGSPQEVAQKLRDSGIPGVRYLDQNSRGAGKGTSNFVVFPGEESKVRIMEINGKPVVIDEEELMRSGLLGQ